MDYQIKSLPTISAAGEASKLRYHKAVSYDGKIWLYADQPNAGDNIYVEGDANSDGFGGRTLEFTLVDGSKIRLKGPWHTNSEALDAATNVDLRSKHYTRCVIGMDKRYDNSQSWLGTIVDVIHYEDDWVLGEFERGTKLARQFADKLQKGVYAYRESQGGSSCGLVKPTYEYGIDIGKMFKNTPPKYRSRHLPKDVVNTELFWKGYDVGRTQV